MSEQSQASERPADPSQAIERARAWYALEFGSRADFDDPSRQWRRLFAEALGTFFLVLVAAGASVVDAKSNGGIGRNAAVAAPA